MNKALGYARQPLRALAMALGALAIGWDLTSNAGLVAAVLGAIGGVFLGERLGKSELRLGVVLGGVAAGALLLWLLAVLCVDWEVVPSLVGPGSALGLATFFRYLAFGLGASTAMRAVATRHPTAMALELAFITIAFAALFSAHRDGVIARPLWLSDWAWENGFDPGDVLLGVGAVAVTILATLLVLENKEERSISSLFVLAALAVIALMLLNAVGRPEPQAGDELGLTNRPSDGEHGNPPPPPDGGGRGRENPGDGGGNGNGGGDGGRGNSPSGGDSGRGNQSGGDGGRGNQGGADGGTGQGGGRDGSLVDAGRGGGGGGQRDGGGSSQGSRPDGGDGGYGWMLQVDGASGNGAGGEGGAQPSGGEGGQGQPPPSSRDGGSSGQPRPRPPSEQLQDDQSARGTPAPMAVVILENDYSPPQGGYYFRQEAWSEYTGLRLVPSTNPAADRDRIMEFPTTRLSSREPPPTRGRTVVNARVAMLVEHTFPFGLETPIQLSPLRNPNPQRFLRSYRVRSLAQSTPYEQLLGRKVGNPRWSDEVKAYYLVNPDDERYQEILDEALLQLPEARRGDPIARAVAIKVWLDKHLTYSTRHRHANVENPVADFLFGDRTGYCVHFAHAATFLFRRAGIPARVGVGYMADEAARQGGSAILIRGSDAHAWPEIYVEGLGWVILDIAAEKNLDPPGQPVDDDLQRLLGEMAREEPPPEEEAPSESKFKITPKMVGITLGVLVALALLVLYLIKATRRLMPLFAGRAAMPRVAYRAALDLLADCGVSRDHGETREAFARRVALVTPTLEKLTQVHVGAKLSAPGTQPPPPAEVRALLRAVRQEVPTATKRWRRWLGYAHPASWLDTR